MTRANNSSDELAAFSAADRLADGLDVPRDELRRLLGALAGESERTREHLDRALLALGESSKRKRENVREIIRMERK